MFIPPVTEFAVASFKLREKIICRLKRKDAISPSCFKPQPLPKTARGEEKTLLFLNWLVKYNKDLWLLISCVAQVQRMLASAIFPRGFRRWAGLGTR
jgi:hypothetical protein